MTEINPYKSNQNNVRETRNISALVHDYGAIVGITSHKIGDQTGYLWRVNSFPTSLGMWISENEAYDSLNLTKKLDNFKQNLTKDEKSPITIDQEVLRVITARSIGF